MNKPNLCIDFDQTIHDKLHPVPGRRMGAPFSDAKSSLRKLRRKYTIIIHTTMANTASGLKCVEDWLVYYKIPYDGIQGKPSAVRYIDDKGLHHKSWSETMKELL